MVKWNGPFRSDRSNREKRSTSKGGPLFSKLFRLDLTDPFSFRPKFPEILVEWFVPSVKSVSFKLPSQSPSPRVIVPKPTSEKCKDNPDRFQFPTGNVICI